jgi:hypothetical protein
VAWQDVEADAPEFASRVRALFQARTHKTLATLREDGSPRISGIETQTGEQVTFGSTAASRKLADLMRDPRLALHSPSVDPPEDDPGAWVGEAKISGRAVPTEDGFKGGYHRGRAHLPRRWPRSRVLASGPWTHQNLSRVT